MAVVGRLFPMMALSGLLAAGCGATSAALTCTRDDQCAATQYCANGACTAGCASDDECAPGVCAAHGRCETGGHDAGSDGAPHDAAPPQVDAPAPDDAPPPPQDVGPQDTLPPQADAWVCTPGAHRCYGRVYQSCTGPSWVDGDTCPIICDEALGCIECAPGQSFCVGDDLYACTADGHQGTLVKSCGQGLCQGLDCIDPCTQAAGNASYIGCEYWATVTMNSQLADGFTYALAVANTGAQPANVTITGGALAGPQTQTIPAASLATIGLPWVPELKETYRAETSLIAANKAYHLKADYPIVVYQFNALEFQSGGGTPSYTNDASLVLPINALQDHYLVMSRAPLMIKETDYNDFIFWCTCGSDSYLSSPGFLTVIATKPGPTHVSIRFAGHAMAVGGVATSYDKGTTGEFDLNEGDVLQIASRLPSSCGGDSCNGNCGSCEYRDCYCDLSADYDLTGSEITASQNVAVFGGHNCDFVPYKYWACDHLEEQLFPVSAWGKHYVAAKTQEPNNHPNLYRILSGADGNSVTLTPLPAGVTGPIALAKGQYYEFASAAPFEAVGTEPFLMAQFMVGQDYGQAPMGGQPGGDPSMALSVPVEQYRTEYVFLAPATYQQNSVTFVAPSGATVMLDGAAVSGFVPVGGYQVATVAIAVGSHSATSSVPFGIMVYGVAPYTSYMYPGGLDLKAQP